MPVTLTMRQMLRGILFFLLLISCNSSANERVKKDPAIDRSEPFDRHATLVFTKHARCRMDCRHITPTEIQEVLDDGEINYRKSDPNGHPDPKYAVEGYTAEHQHLRIIVAPEDQKLIIITCIELGVEWSCHCN